MTAVFLTFHGIGHFHACFRMARLVSKSHTVVFAGFPGFQALVESQGFGFYPLLSMPFALGFEEWVNGQDKNGNPWVRSLRDRWNGRLFNQRDKDLTVLLDRLRPDTILIDAQQATDFVVLYPHARSRGIKLAIVHTALPLVLRTGYPPVSSLANPENRMEVSISTARFRLHRFLRKGWSFIKYAGKTNHTMVSEKMTSNRTPAKYLSNSISHLSVHINAPDEFILSPEEFDFSSPAKSPSEHYIGFMPDLKRRERGGGALADLFAFLEGQNQPLVYFSFGTVSGDDVEVVNRFFKRFLDAVNGQPFAVAISTMAVSGHASMVLPNNVFLFSPAPQWTLLRRASVFVTHGGFNSIKESIYAGVPMLVYPRDPRLDQNGNATRITFSKLGLRGSVLEDGSTEILKKINILLQDATYKARVEAFRAIDERYTDERFLALFDGMRLLD